MTTTHGLNSTETHEFTAIDFDDLPYRPVKPRHLLAPKRKSKFRHGQFIAWDGEGITTPDGHHHYMLLCNSEGLTLSGSFNEDGTVKEGISSNSCFSALIATAKDHPKAIHVIYYGGYDFNLILRDVPLASLLRLNEGKPAYFGQYTVKVLFGKRLWIKDRTSGVTITLWDVGSFFQQSFVKSLKTWDVDIPVDVYENIVRQKANRDSFSADQIDEIEAYCKQELMALVKLMIMFRDALADCGITISQWHGPGAIAGYLYKLHGTKDHKVVPDDYVNRAAQYAYGGGRIESCRKGHHGGRCYYYDVRSCYPFAIAELPSLANASWDVYQGPNYEVRDFSLYRISWNFPIGQPFYCGRHRHANGGVCYPEVSLGNWFWTPELKLFIDYYPGMFKVDECLLFNGKVDSRPFAWVHDMYQLRREMKAQGKGSERILKLGLNSLYGKMIQQVGWKPPTDGAHVGKPKLPAYHQLEWGGYVTSCARAMLFRAAISNSSVVVGFETDGIVTTDLLDVDLGENLGQWECEEFNGVTYVQSGFYWLDKPDGTVKTKYRGFDPGSVTREMVLNAWANNEETVIAKLTRPIGLAYALHTNNLRQWGDWVTSERELNIADASSKRIHNCQKGLCRGYGQTLDQSLHDTYPYGMGTTFSHPYPLEWISELPEWKAAAMAFDLELPDINSYRWG